MPKSTRKKMLFGNNVSIHPMYSIQANVAGIRYRDDVSVAYGAAVIAKSHTYTDIGMPIKYQEMTSE